MALATTGVGGHGVLVVWLLLAIVMVALRRASQREVSGDLAQGGYLGSGIRAMHSAYPSGASRK